MEGLLKKIPTKDVAKEGWPWTEEFDPEIYASRNVWPKISIVTPSYNQGQFIEETIRSILLQNYPNLEYIIIDGGSTDNTVEIIKKYEPWINYWVSEADNGQSNAINKGFRVASGDILNWINSDDFLSVNALHSVASFNWVDGIEAIVGIGHKINSQGAIVYTPEVPELSTSAFYDWCHYGHFMQPACFFTKKAWLTCGPINENLFFCMDVELWIKISKKYKFGRLNNVVAYANAHESAKTTAFVDKMKLETFLMVAANGDFETARKRTYELFQNKIASKEDKGDKSIIKKIMQRLRG